MRGAERPISLGDTHNFGRSVSQVWVNGAPRIQKPRCGFWEYFFLSPVSPFRSMGAPNSFIFELLGSIDINFLGSEAEGIPYAVSAARIDSTDIFDRLAALRSLGGLLAVCSSFGITDVHRDNVKPCGNRFQIIDIEAVFHQIKLGQETHIIPGPKVAESLSILGAYFPHLDGGLSADESAEFVLAIRCGFKSLRLWLNDYREELGQVISAYGEIPVRAILRPTALYREACATGDLRNLFDAEVEQMQRGDIPYFWRSMDDSALKFYGPDGKVKTVSTQSIESSKLKIAPLAQLSELLCNARLLCLEKTVLCEIAKNLLSTKFPEFSTDGLLIHRRAKHLVVKIDGFEYLVPMLAGS